MMIVDGQPVDPTEYSNRKDGRIVASYDRKINMDTGEITRIIMTGPPTSHLPHTQRLHEEVRQRLLQR